jgi:membrane-associated phospholipid phosphatase
VPPPARTGRSRPSPTRRAALAAAVFALACAAGAALLYLAAVRTAAGQRLDERLRGRIDTSEARIQSAGNDLLNTVSVTSLTLMGTLIMAGALVRGRPRMAVGAGLVVLGANITTQVMKSRLERPALTDAWWDGAGSYPSGHATVAMSLAMALVLVAPTALRLPLAIVGGAYALGVGVAVIGLDWHRPSDVLGAYLVAATWAGAVAAALTLWPDRAPAGRAREERARAWGIGIAVVLAGVLAVVLVRAAGDPELTRLAADRTGLIVAGALCSVAGAVLLAAVVSLTARGPAAGAATRRRR